MDFQKKIFEEILISPNHNEQIVSIICSALKSCSPKEYPRINKILKDIINNNKKELKKECYKGLPENLPSLRALIWKINFKYIPHKIQNWNATIKSYRTEYKELKNAVIIRQREEIKIFEELKDNQIYEEESKNNNGNKNIKLIIPLWCFNVGKKYSPTKNSTHPTNNKVPTSLAVANYIHNAFAHEDAMIYKGTLGIGGTINTVPITDYSAGYVYRIITAARYAGY